MAEQPFLTDVQALRKRARAQMENGPVTDTYGGDVARTIEILQSVLATELVCVLRYTQHSIVATGLASESVSAEFAQHAKEEQGHAMQVAERINQLGGAPDFGLERSPPGWLTQPNLFFKVSSTNLYILEEAKIPERPYLRFLVDRVGAKRILWGSDIGTAGGSYLELVRRGRAATAHLTPSEQRQVLRETGMGVFKPAG